MSGNLERGIDHIVVCVNSLDAAIARWQSYGFTTTPVARHPWGTINSLVQFDGNFVELLAIGDSDAIVEPDDDQFSFGAWNQDWLRRGEGMSMLVFEGHDSRADVAEFKQAGIKTFPAFDFERPAKLPDGSSVTVGFSLAFALDDAMPRSAFFTCHQQAPEYFWKKDYQSHANGGRQIVKTILVDNEPAKHTAFFQKLQGTSAVQVSDGQLHVQTARGSVVVMDATEWQRRYPGVGVDVSDGAVFMGVEVSVSNLAQLPAAFSVDTNGRAWLDTGGLILEVVVSD